MNERWHISRLFRRTEGKGVFLETLCVACLGIVFGFVANAVSPKGLGLAQDYFPAGLPPSAPQVATTNSTSHTFPEEVNPGTNAIADSPAATRLKQKGLQMIDGVQAWELFNDPRYQQHLIVFIDARDDRHYAEGHIPGAAQFDHYRPEKYLLQTLSICQMAEQIVVYCNGGDCEDSEFAAIMLRDAGVPNQKLFVYSGGITEWMAKKFPVTTGDQP